MNTPGLRACGYKTAPGRSNWPNRDPIGEKGGMNLFAFNLNEPNDHIDAMGLKATPKPYPLPSVIGYGAFLQRMLFRLFADMVNHQHVKVRITKHVVCPPGSRAEETSYEKHFQEIVVGFSIHPRGGG
jgi:hypothetical protein